MFWDGNLVSLIIILMVMDRLVMIVMIGMHIVGTAEAEGVIGRDRVCVCFDSVY